MATSVATATYTPVPTRRVSNATAGIYTDSLRVRSEPSESSNIIGGVSRGQIYRVLNISEDGIWIRLAVAEIPNGWGWVPARFTSVKGDITGIAISNDSIGSIGVTPTSTPSSGDAVVNITGSRLRVRSGPSANDAIISYVYKGSVHRVLEQSRNGLWVRLAIDNQPDGGWVSASYVELGRDVPDPGQTARALPPTATATSTPTREPTSTVAPSTATATQTSAPQSLANLAIEDTVGVATVRTTDGSRLRVRAQPDPSASILGHAYSDRSYIIFAKTIDDTWVQISIPELAISGWISTEYLDLTLD